MDIALDQKEEIIRELRARITNLEIENESFKVSVLFFIGFVFNLCVSLKKTKKKKKQILF